MLTLENMPRSRARFEGDVWAFGLRELDAFDALPTPLRDALAEEAYNDREFLHGYVIPVLRSPNPYGRFMVDMEREAQAELAGLEHGFRGVDGLDDLGKSFLKKVAKTVRKVHKKVAQTVRKVHAKITPKPLQKIQKKVHAVAKKTWVKYGNVIIAVAGAVLTPFTLGLSNAAASVLIAANTMYAKKKAADEAKKAAKADAGKVKAEADAAAMAAMKQVDDFFNANQAWFIQNGMTPDKWAKLTLDQKIEFIRAGAAGTLPTGSQPVSDPTGTTSTTPVNQGPTTGGAAPGTSAPTGGDPGGWGAPSGGGGGGGGGAYDYKTAEQSDAAAAAAPKGKYEIFIEGKSVGTFDSMPAATDAILKQSQRGDRLEIVYNGQSLGLRLRTSGGSIDVPSDVEAAVRTMDRSKMEAIVTQAEKDLGQGGTAWGSVLPWVGGAAAVIAFALSGGRK